MRYRPPKGVAPPWLDGKRTGRPKGRRNYARHWNDVLWAYEHRYEDRVQAPTSGALIWWHFATMYPDELADFLEEHRRI